MQHSVAFLLRRASRTRPEHVLAVAAGSVLLAGLVAVPTVSDVERTASLAPAACVADCAPDAPSPSRQDTERPSPAPSPAPATKAPARALPPPAAPRLASPAPKPRATPRVLSVRRTPVRVPLGVDRATASAIGRMQLTPEGYRDAVRRIDQSHFDYAQRFVEFDPDRVPVEQGPSQVFVWHFTAFYRNAGGPSASPEGRMAIRPFIKGLATRGDKQRPADHVCCGVNWLIDRDGPVHQLAPVNAKLRHNPPYDSINTGVEIEAARQGDITTEQYESAAYLTIAVLDAQGLLGRRPLHDIVKGHGEMRDAYRAGNPHSHWGSRSDFDAPESRMLRGVIDAFLTAHPEVVRLQPRLR